MISVSFIVAILIAMTHRWSIFLKKFNNLIRNNFNFVSKRSEFASNAYRQMNNQNTNIIQETKGEQRNRGEKIKIKEGIFKINLIL